jgi:microcystin-dependent protein
MATDIQRKEWFTADHAEVNARGAGIRFKDFNEPPQFQFERLFRSTLFKLNESDRARSTQAGHVILSSNAQVKNRTSIGGDVMNDNNHTNTVQPHNLPSAAAIDNGAERDDFPNTAIEIVATGTVRDDYTFRMTPAWYTKLITRLIPRGGAAGDVLIKQDGTDYNFVPGDLSQNTTFVTNLGANDTFVTQLLANQDFYDILLANDTFITNLSTTIINNSPTLFTEGLEVGFMRYYPKMSGFSAKWLRMDGSAVSRTDYAELFALLGEDWGPGDSSTTFNLPDFRDRGAIGYSAGIAIATYGGSETHTISSSNLPTHSHSAGTLANDNAGDHTHTASWNGIPNTLGTNLAATGIDSRMMAPLVPPTDVTVTVANAGDHTHTITGNTGNGGFANTAINHRSPYGAVNFLIKALP